MMMNKNFLRLHASCVSIDGRGVLLVGPSGVGKSDVALRLIDAGAELVSDDQTELRLVEGGAIVAAPPAPLAGLIEVRGVGLLRLPSWSEATVSLYVDLLPLGAAVERLPEKAYYDLMGQKIKMIRCFGFAASTPAVIRASLDGLFEDV